MGRRNSTKNVAVIGGSAAGFYTAYLLANQGVQVRVFEAADSIDPVPRSLIVTEYFEDLLGPIGRKSVIHQIRHFELFTDGRAATITLTRPDLVIERKTLIKELAKKAEACGAKIFTGKRFLDLKPNGGHLTFSVSDHRNGQTVQETAETIVGADGTFSMVAKCIGLAAPETLPLIQAVVDLPQDLSPDTTRVWFVPEETPYFFWLIPHSATQGVLGLIGAQNCDTTELIGRFLEKRGLRPKAFQAAPIPNYTRWRSNRRKIGGNDVYLVGDAAGHVKISTVGGVVTGLRGAVGTSEAIMNGGSSPELDALKSELDRHRLIRQILNRFTQTEYSRLLDLLTPCTKRSLGLFTRDQSNRLLKSIIVEQPRLLLLVLTTLLFRSSPLRSFPLPELSASHK